MKTVIVIPARFASGRFPGKPLALIKGKTLIERVFEICLLAHQRELIFVATDDERIFSYCLEKKFNPIMTSSTCLTGTDRIYEVSKKIPADIYINVQGDEPLISPLDIKKIIQAASNSPSQVICAMCEIKTQSDFNSSSVPKVATDLDRNLLYISRAAIPTDKNLSFSRASKQVCIYSFPREKLKIFGEQTRKTPLELIEDIEILRFLELGISVKMIPVSDSSIAVDYPMDIDRVERELELREGFKNDG